MTRALSAFILLFGLIGLAGAKPASPHDGSTDQVTELLTSAAQAVRKQNYRGIMVYLRESQLDTLRVIHRFDGVEQERLVSLTGQPREVIRRGGQVTSILPKNKVVLVSERRGSGLLGSVSDFSPERMQAHYSLSDQGKRRLADRLGHMISIKPRDEFRYGYRMLIDDQTHLPLKLVLLRDGDVLEQLMFTEINFPEHIPNDAFKPSHDIDGYRVIEHKAVQVGDRPVPQNVWVPTDLPPGFKLAEDGVRRVSKDAYVRQMLFTDGVATVSAFIAPAGLRKPLQGATTMGAVNAFGHTVADTQITVVGEVPAVTVKQIANHIVRKDAARR